MNRRVLLVGLASFLMIGIVALGVFLFSAPAGFLGTAYGEPYPVAQEIELARDNGTRFRLSEMRGRVVMLFFGYTSCPDICPATMANLKVAVERLGAEDEKKIQVVFITVDPKRDTAKRVQEYVDHFNQNFIGLSGTEDELVTIWQNYGVFREDVEGSPSAAGLVNHTARITLIDQHGNMRLSFAYDTPVDDIVHDLKLLLK